MIQSVIEKSIKLTFVSFKSFIIYNNAFYQKIKNTAMLLNLCIENTNYS